MFFYVLTCGLIAFCILDYKGKIFYWVMLVLMYLLMAYQTWNADTTAYRHMFAAVSLTNLDVSDTGFTFLIYLAKQMHLDYFDFVKVVAVLGLTLVTICFRKYSVCPSIVLVYYFIFTYSVETIQLRAFLSEAVLYMLIARIMQEDRINLKAFFLLLSISFLFHNFAFFYIILLLLLWVKDRKKLLIISIASGFSLSLFLRLLMNFPIAAIRRRILIYMDEQREAVSSKAIIFVAVFLLITLAILLFERYEKNPEWRKKLDRLISIHYIGLISCILIVLYSSNFYRMTRTIIVVDFIVLFNYLFKTKKMDASLLTMIIVLAIAYFLGYEMITHPWNRILQYNTALGFLI